MAGREYSLLALKVSPTKISNLEKALFGAVVSNKKSVQLKDAKKLEKRLIQRYGNGFKRITKDIFETVAGAFQYETDIVNGSKWPELKRSTARDRSVQLGPSKAKHPILVRSGRMRRAATGGQMRRTGGPGVAKNGSKLIVSVQHNFSPTSGRPMGSLHIGMSGDQAKHMHGYHTMFKGKEVYIPARPFFPTMNKKVIQAIRAEFNSRTLADIIYTMPSATATARAYGGNTTFSDLAQR